MISSKTSMLSDYESSERGQGTVEYALATAALIALIVGISSLLAPFLEGKFIDHAVASASHRITAAAPLHLADVFNY